MTIEKIENNATEIFEKLEQLFIDKGYFREEEKYISFTLDGQKDRKLSLDVKVDLASVNKDKMKDLEKTGEGGNLVVWIFEKMRVDLKELLPYFNSANLQFLYKKFFTPVDLQEPEEKWFMKTYDSETQEPVTEEDLSEVED